MMIFERGREMSMSGRYAGRFLLLVCLGALAACAKVAVKAPPPASPLTSGFIRGTLAADDSLGVSLAGTEIRTETHTAIAVDNGLFAFPEMPPGKHLFVAEKRFAQGAVRRIMGVSTIYVADTPIEVRIRIRDATDLDAYCSDCHPAKGKVTRRDQIVRDVHPSGVVPLKANKPTAKLDGNGKVTCESCHTIHRATDSPHFTLAGYSDGVLCLRCH